MINKMHGYNDYPPHLFYKGTVKISVILEQAQRDTNGINKLNKVHELFGTPAVGLVARIRRYINGEALKMPEAINNEKYPFKAIKYAHCTDWDKFNEENGSINDLAHLRAYFWDCNPYGEELMCITHFLRKQTEKLHPKDTEISLQERDKFEKNGFSYED